VKSSIQSRLAALVAVITVIALAIGATVGYSLSTERTSTITNTQIVTRTSISTVTQTTSATPCPLLDCRGLSDRTFAFSNILPNFTLGSYSFRVSFQVPNSTGNNGTTTVFLGQYATFNVSNSSSTESVMFSWSPNVNMDKTVPDPVAVRIFDGRVVMNTFANSTGSYVTIFVYSLSNTPTSSSPSTETTLSHSSSSVAGIYHIPTNGTLIVYVKYYYYNSTAANDFNFSGGQQFFIYSFTQQKMTLATNAAVTSNVSDVPMGGPQNRSEGIPVEYKIHFKDEVNGTYALNFGWLYPSMDACAADFEIAIGNVPYPTVDAGGGCTASLSTRYPVNSQGFVDGFLFVELISVSNDTSWQVQYYGYNGAPCGVFTPNGSFVSGNFNGSGDYVKSVTISGPVNKGLGICALAKKLDMSENNLTVSVGNSGNSNSTNLALGSTYICTGVYP